MRPVWPQSYAWGAEAQVDWYEADAELGGERVKLQVFAIRSMASGAAFHCACRHATQQAFLEAHSRAVARRRMHRAARALLAAPAADPGHWNIIWTSQFATLAEQAIREKKSTSDMWKRCWRLRSKSEKRNTIERRIRETHLPRMKTIEESDFTQSRNVTAAKMRDLAEGGY